MVGLLPGFEARDANRWVRDPDRHRHGPGAQRDPGALEPTRSSRSAAAYGTLSEIALALKLGRPVVGLGTWRLAQPEGRRVPLTSVRTPEEAVARALRAARRGGGGRRGWLV